MYGNKPKNPMQKKQMKKPASNNSCMNIQDPQLRRQCIAKKNQSRNAKNVGRSMHMNKGYNEGY